MSSDRNDIAPGRAELREEVLLPHSTGSVCVRALHGALSRGTERLIFSGRVPKSEFDRMRAPFMVGAFPFPVKYGYSVVGQIETGPRELRGRAVFALHPHQTPLIIPMSAAVPLPESLMPARAVLAANMETALNAVWDASPENGDRIAIVGVGVIGALVGYLCRRIVPNVHVTLVDINPARGPIASALGLNFAMPESAPTECDLVVHPSATASGLATALNLARDEAIVLELSWYGAGDVPVPLGGAFHSRRLRSISSQVARSRPRTAIAGPTVHAWKQPLATLPTRNSTRCSHLRWHSLICLPAYREFLRHQAAFYANVSTTLETGGQLCLPSKFATTS